MEVKSKKLMAFSYFGGKNMHLRWLLPVLNAAPATAFVDLLCGSAAVGLNMDKELITINDINGDIVNFFQVLRNHADTLITKLQLTPYSQFEYKAAWNVNENCPIERARNFYVRVMQSFGSTGIQKEYNSWSYSTNNTNAKLSAHVAKWLRGVNGLHDIVSKLREIQIESRHYSKIIDVHGQKNTLIYADPPYPIESRTGHIRYAYEFDAAEHQNLSQLLHQTPAFVAVSGYRCDLMDTLYADFYISTDKLRRTNSPGSHRQECVWTNYDPASTTKLTLF